MNKTTDKIEDMTSFMLAFGKAWEAAFDQLNERVRKFLEDVERYNAADGGER